MMRPRWHKVLADLFGHTIRSLLVIASIAVGLFAIGMITTSYVILSEDIRASYRAANPANIQVAAASFDDDFVRRIANLPNIDQTQGVRNLTLRVRAAAGEWKPISVRALDADGLSPEAINRVTPAAGTWPPADEQIVLEQTKLFEIGAALGDEVEIKLPSGLVRRMPVVGLVRDQTIGASGGEGGFFLAPVQGYITLDTLPWLEQPEAFNTLYATVEQGQEDRAAVRAAADSVLEEFDRLGYVTASSMARASSQHPNLAYVDAMVAVIYFLGFLVVFLSGFLITNTLSALLNQQVQQIGVMKTIGASRWQISGVYMVLILVFSVIALVIAVPLSQRAAHAFLAYLSEQINFRVLSYRAVPAAALLQAVIALVVPQLAGGWPILQGTRISVNEALSGVTAAQIDDNGPVYRLLARVRGFSRPMLISLRNTFRRRARLILTLVTLTLGGAIFISTFNVRYSIEAYIDQLRSYFVADINLTFSQPYRIDRVLRDVREVPGVAAVEGWSGAQAQLVRGDGSPGENVQMLAPPAGSDLIQPILLRGRWIEPGDQNAITLSELFLEEVPGIEVGDTIRLKVNQKETDWVVVGFFQFAGRSSGLFAYTSYDYLARQTGMYGRSSFFRVVAAGDDHSLAAQEALGRRVEAHLVDQGYEIAEISPGLSIQEKTSKGLDILTTFLLIMSFLMASVGSIGLMGTMSLNVMERTREIGVMRAVGGSNRAIISIVLVEGILIGLLSWVLANFVALPISQGLADVMFQIIFDRGADLALKITGNAIWLGAVLVLSVAASVIPAYNASRLTIREVLAYE